MESVYCSFLEYQGTIDMTSTHLDCDKLSRAMCVLYTQWKRNPQRRENVVGSQDTDARDDVVGFRPCGDSEPNSVILWDKRTKNACRS
jgi:hypothetical protein